jgi:uncharacterized membrane protein
MIKLIGVAIVAVGFALRWNTLLVVLISGVVTGLVAGLPLIEILRLIGTFFVDNRFMTLPVVLLVPVIGLLERHGLQERAAVLIRRMSAATSGRIMLVYQLMRELTSMVGLAIGGHASMVRPLIAPMAEAAAKTRLGSVSKELTARIRAHAAAAENWGNFFADDIIVAVGPVLLMKGVFDAAGVPVTLWSLGLWGLPTALAALLLGAWRFRKLDREIELQRAGGDAPPSSLPTPRP